VLLINSKLSQRFAGCFLLAAAPFLISYLIWNKLGKPALLSGKIPEGVGSLGSVSNIVKKDLTFLSGSTVFWADALADIYQVRGGRDQVAVHPTWDKAAWEFREGPAGEKTLEWVKKYKVKYVLVHTPDSKEYYHDFKNLEKWSGIGKSVFEGEGDILFKMP